MIDEGPLPTSPKGSGGKTKVEFEKLKSDLIFQNGISSWGGTRKLPFAFTEQGRGGMMIDD